MRTLLLGMMLLAIAVVPMASAAPDVQVQCVSAIDDVISDGGSTYCVNKDGCLVWESREYIWGREYYCYP